MLFFFFLIVNGDKFEYYNLNSKIEWANSKNVIQFNK